MGDLNSSVVIRGMTTEQGGRRLKIIRYSRKGINWLEHLREETGADIRHAENGGEFKVPGTNYSVDGFCRETNTVYEFYGCLFHGCPVCYDPEAMAGLRFLKRTNRQLWTRTVEKELHLRDLGFGLVITWEHEWDATMRTLRAMSRVIRRMVATRGELAREEFRIEEPIRQRRRAIREFGKFEGIHSLRTP